MSDQLEESRTDLEKIVEEELIAESGKDEVESVKDKRDALPSASRLSSHHVLPPPHDIPPHSGLPLFPPLGTAPPHAALPAPTPVPGAHHHAVAHSIPRY